MIETTSTLKIVQTSSTPKEKTEFSSKEEGVPKLFEWVNYKLQGFGQRLLNTDEGQDAKALYTEPQRHPSNIHKQE